jgi:hypothetical protein
MISLQEWRGWDELRRRIGPLRLTLIFTFDAKQRRGVVHRSVVALVVPLQAQADQGDDGGVDRGEAELRLGAPTGDQVVDDLDRIGHHADHDHAEDHQRPEQRVEVFQREPSVRVLRIGRPCRRDGQPGGDERRRGVDQGQDTVELGRRHPGDGIDDEAEHGQAEHGEHVGAQAALLCRDHVHFRHCCSLRAVDFGPDVHLG